MSDKDDYVLAYLEQWRDELTSHDGDREDFEKTIAIQKAQARVIQSATEVSELWNVGRGTIDEHSLNRQTEALAALDEVKKG